MTDTTTSTYCITAKGSATLHTVAGAMNDHRPWQDALTTACGRQIVAGNYFDSLAEYRRTYNINGKACSQCEKEAGE